MKLRFLALCKPVHVRIVSTKAGDGLLPELERHLACHVAAESVDAAFHPETEGSLHSLPDFLVLVVEVGGVRPVGGIGGVAFGITLIPVWSLSGYPYCIWRSVVCDPVDDHAKSELVSFCNEVVEVFERTELRVDVTIVSYSVV